MQISERTPQPLAFWWAGTWENVWTFGGVAVKGRSGEFSEGPEGNTEGSTGCDKTTGTHRPLVGRAGKGPAFPGSRCGAGPSGSGSFKVCKSHFCACHRQQIYLTMVVFIIVNKKLILGRNHVAFFSSAPAFMPSCQDFCSGICSVMMSPSCVGTGWWESASLARRGVSLRAQRQSEVHDCVLGAAVLHTR